MSGNSILYRLHKERLRLSSLNINHAPDECEFRKTSATRDTRCRQKSETHNRNRRTKRPSFASKVRDLKLSYEHETRRKPSRTKNKNLLKNDLKSMNKKENLFEHSCFVFYKILINSIVEALIIA